MTNNDILTSLKTTFNFSEQKIVDIFKLADHQIELPWVSPRLQEEDLPSFKPCSDRELSSFLNGFVIDQRGPKDGEQPASEDKISNNLILRKLKIALNLQNSDIIDTLEASGYRASKSEITAFFRKPDHKDFRFCSIEIIEHFLKGLALKYSAES